MLVLTRRVGEKIVIDGNIVVTVCQIRGYQQCRIGIEAPKEMPILREELIDERHEPEQGE
jgi:carbon storage regulator